MEYQNGILINILPPAHGAWACGYVTPLSDGANKDEYVFPPGSQFTVVSHAWETIKKKNVLVLTLEQKIH